MIMMAVVDRASGLAARDWMNGILAVLKRCTMSVCVRRLVSCQMILRTGGVEAVKGKRHATHPWRNQWVWKRFTSTALSAVWMP